MSSSITQPHSDPPGHAGPEPLTPEYLRAVKDRVIATRPGPWDLYSTDDGSAFGFGPFSFVEPWDDTELVPAIEFCRQARADVPALLGEIARLRTRLTELEERAHELRAFPLIPLGGPHGH